MADSVQQYILSGVLEAYVIGSLPESEEGKVLQMKRQYPAVNSALLQLEDDMETMAMQMAITPPPALWSRIESQINGLIETNDDELGFRRRYKHSTEAREEKPEPHYIEVEAQSDYLKVHRLWRWAFAAVFLLGKIFLATAIYFYIENKHNQQEVNDLKARVNQLQQIRR